MSVTKLVAVAGVTAAVVGLISLNVLPSEPVSSRVVSHIAVDSSDSEGIGRMKPPAGEAVLGAEFEQGHPQLNAVPIGTESTAGHRPISEPWAQSPAADQGGPSRATTNVVDEAEQPNHHAAEPAVDDYEMEISGRVVDNSGYALSGIEVTIEPIPTADAAFAPTRDWLTTTGTSTWTNPQGRYRFRGLAPGEYHLSTESDANRQSARINVRAGIENADLVLHAIRTINIRGVVRNSRGEPLESVEIVPRQLPSAQTYSAADGSYAFDFSLAGWMGYHSVAFHHPHYQSAVIRFSLTDEFSNQLHLDANLEPLGRVAQVSGVVQNELGRRLPSQRVTLASTHSSGHYNAITDAFGRFNFSAVAEADDYRLRVRSDGQYRDYWQTDVVIRGGRTDLPVVLEPLPTGRLSGQMLDTNGLPIPNLTLWLQSSQNVNGMAITGDGQGFFQAEAVPAGELELKSRSAPYFAVKDLYLPEARESHVDLVFNLGAHELRGQVVDSDGNPVSLPVIHLISRHSDFSANSTVTRTVATDVAGRFRFSHLGHGVHQLMINNPSGYYSRRLVYEVNPDLDLGGELRVELQELYQ